MTDTKREIRKHLLIMVALILAIDAVAIAIFAGLGIPERPRDVRLGFTAAWTFISLLVVLNGLYRIRVTRNAARRRGR
jgi:hypothetical protein